MSNFNFLSLSEETLQESQMILQSAIVPFNMKIKSLLKFGYNEIKRGLLFTALCWFNQRKQVDHLIHFTVRQNVLV